VTRVVPYSDLNSAKRLPSTTRAMTSRGSAETVRDTGTAPYSSSSGTAGGSAGRRSQAGAAGGGRVSTMERTICRACRSSTARWSATPETRACTAPPPRSSAETTSPVAALTSGGPPRKIVPCCATITVSSLIAGTYAPPAVLDPSTAEICAIPAADIRAWL